jgi:hypothetical protein
MDFWEWRKLSFDYLDEGYQGSLDRGTQDEDRSRCHLDAQGRAAVFSPIFNLITSGGNPAQDLASCLGTQPNKLVSPFQSEGLKGMIRRQEGQDLY